MTNGWMRTDPIASHIWLQLLLDANWERRQLKNGQAIERGQLVIGRAKYADSIGISVQQLRTNLSAFEKCEMLTRQSTSRGTLITLIKYEEYQDIGDGANQPTNQQLTSNQPATNQQLTSSQPQNKNLRSKEVKKGRKREGFAPPSLEEVRSYCNGRRNGIDPQAFIDAGLQSGWKLSNGNAMKDWKAAIRTWERREKERKSAGMDEKASSTAAYERRMREVAEKRLRREAAEASRQAAVRGGNGAARAVGFSFKEPEQ
jgi:hypothetical protein